MELEVQDIGAISSILAGPLASTAAPAGKSRDAQLDKVARQFEAMFMSEMIHCARPANEAAGAFAGGKSEATWQMFMDQALGQAAATNGPAGDQSLHEAIVKALREADSHYTQGKPT